MTTEQRLDRLEGNLDRLVAVQDQMMDLLGMTAEGERRLAARIERIEQADAKLRETIQEIGDKLNGLIGVVDGFTRGKQ